MTLPPQVPGPHPSGPRSASRNAQRPPVQQGSTPYPPSVPKQPLPKQPQSTRPAPPHPAPGLLAQPPAIPIAPTAQPDVDPRLPQFRRFDLPVSTTDELPGGRLGHALGVVFGVVTRPRDLAHNPEMAYINTAARQDAVAAMVAQAIAIGADAVVGMRFDGGKISDGVSEITAYGTAVSLSV